MPLLSESSGDLHPTRLTLNSTLPNGFAHEKSADGIRPMGRPSQEERGTDTTPAGRIPHTVPLRANRYRQSIGLFLYSMLVLEIQARH